MSNSTELLALARRCVHCGMCLPACPTYQVFGTEMDAPRGRIVLAKALAEGAIPATDRELMTHLDRCLACRACEAACPSGVQFGEILELARTTLAAGQPTQSAGTPGTGGSRAPDPGPMGAAHPGSLPLVVPEKRSAMACAPAGLPPRTLAGHGSAAAASQARLAPAAAGRGRPARPRVAVFSGCVQDAFLSEVNQATIAVLEKSGFEVVVPETQTCCGALHAHLGEHDRPATWPAATSGPSRPPACRLSSSMRVAVVRTSRPTPSCWAMTRPVPGAAAVCRASV